MAPHVMLMVGIGGLLSLYILARAAAELRQRVRTERPREKPPFNWGVLVVWLPYLLVYTVLGLWWPKAQIPFMLIWFGCIALGLIVLLIVRLRHQHRS